MDGDSINVELERGEVYIDEKPDAMLKIYIPHDDKAQDECIQSTLPKMLVQWIMTKPGSEEPQPFNEAAIGHVMGLLNAKLVSLPRILEKGGIIDVDVPNADIEDEEVRGVASAPAVPLAPCTPERSPSVSSVAPNDVFTPHPPENPDDLRWGQETPLTDPFSVASPAPLRAPVSGGYFSRTHLSPEPQRESAAVYQKLLDHVIQASRSARFPSHGGFDLSALRDALPGSLGSIAPAQSFCSSRFSTFEIGAAGELFVSTHS
jgi:hypothetical protein